MDSVLTFETEKQTLLNNDRSLLSMSINKEQRKVHCKTNSRMAVLSPKIQNVQNKKLNLLKYVDQTSRLQKIFIIIYLIFFAAFFFVPASHFWFLPF